MHIFVQVRVFSIQKRKNTILKSRCAATVTNVFGLLLKQSDIIEEPNCSFKSCYYVQKAVDRLNTAGETHMSGHIERSPES
jgi:hypothetical protein